MPPLNLAAVLSRNSWRFRRKLAQWIDPTRAPPPCSHQPKPSPPAQPPRKLLQAIQKRKHFQSLDQRPHLQLPHLPHPPHLQHQHLQQHPHLNSRAFHDSSPPSAPLHPSSESHQGLLLRLQNLDQHYRYRGYSLLRILFVSLISGGAYIYIFQDDIKDKAAGEISDVASRSLEDNVMRTRAQELSKSVVHGVLRDSKTLDSASSFVKDMATKEETREAVVGLLRQIISDPVLIGKVNQFVSLLIREIVKDELVFQTISAFVNRLLVEPTTRESFVKLLWMTMADPYFKKYSADFTRWVFSTPEVSGQFYKLAVDSSLWTFSDPVVQQKASNWLIQILKEDEIHAHGGDAVWNIFMHSITPNILRKAPLQQNMQKNDQTEHENQDEEQDEK